MATKVDVDDFVAQPVLAVVGVSRTGKKFSNSTMTELRDKGYKVYPVNRDGGEVNGERLYTSLQELPETPGGALIMVKSEAAEAVVRDAAAAGIKRVWLQQGVNSPAALQAAKELGLKTVSGECILMFAGVNKFHGFHRWIAKVFGMLPK